MQSFSRSLRQSVSLTKELPSETPWSGDSKKSRRLPLFRTVLHRGAAELYLVILIGNRGEMNRNGDGNGIKISNGGGIGSTESDYIRRFHRHDDLAENQCSSALVKHIKAPIHLVWSLVRRFDQPQKYKPFISRCVVRGNLEIGSLREVDVKSGLPATTSTERLEKLDDDEHILGFRIVGGDHRLKNYSSVVTLHPEIIEGRPATLVTESFVVDVPEGNTKDETCYFVEALIRCNLKSLADVSEKLAVQDRTEPLERI